MPGTNSRVCQVHVGFEVLFKLVCPSPSPQPQHYQSFRNKQGARMQSFSSQIFHLINCENELQVQLAFILILQFLFVVLCFHVGLFVVLLHYLQCKYNMVQHIMK